MGHESVQECGVLGLFLDPMSLHRKKPLPGSPNEHTVHQGHLVESGESKTREVNLIPPSHVATGFVWL